MIKSRAIFFWVLAKFALILVFAYAAGKLIPYLGFFPYKEVLENSHLPGFVSSLANFDGIHYLLIAQGGYTQYQQAFFPLYPLLIRWLQPLFFHNYLLTGLFIANISLAVGLYYFLRTFGSGKNRSYLLSLILLFPTAFFYNTVYTESLFFLWVALTFYLASRQKFWQAGLTGLLAAATRLMGVFLVIPLLISAWSSRDRRQLFWALWPIFGLLGYMLYLQKSVGDPLAFFHSQAVFGEARSTHLILLPQVYFRYLKIFFTADWSHAYFVSLIETLIFTVFLIILALDLKKQLRKKRLLLISLSLFSLINLLLPTLTGSFMSIPRFALLSLSGFLYLANLKSLWLKYSLLVLFAAVQILLLGLFVQGYFIS